MGFKLVLSTQQIIIHLVIISVNVFLFVFTRRLHGLIYGDEIDAHKLLAMRTLIGLFLSLQIVDIIFHQALKSYENIVLKAAFSIATIYFSLAISNAITVVMRRRFGAQREVDGQKRYTETYNSRLATICSYAGLIFIATYLIIKIWGLNSLLQTTGIFGLVFGFIAFTNPIWAPDIYSGMVILKTDLMRDGETIRLNNELFIINRLTFVFTSLLSIKQNNRTILRNSQLIADRIDNLTRRGATEGVRQKLVYKVGYPELLSLAPMERRKALDEFMQRIDKMFAVVTEEAGKNETLAINKSRPFEWFLTQTGDYALEFTLYYFLTQLPITHIIAKVRRHVIGTRNAINMLVYRHSILSGVDLATPLILSHANSPAERFLNPIEVGMEKPQEDSVGSTP